MKINLWYCKRMEQWRWTLSTEDGVLPVRQEAGQRSDLRQAMNDVAVTVEYMMKETPNQLLG